MADEAQDGGVRAPRPRRARLLVPGLVWVLLSAAPAWSSQVVQVRVGNHPTFTRVVFEFDAPTGYRIERRTDGEIGHVIVVTLDAGSRARTIVSHSQVVESVSVEAGSARAVARIATRKPGLPIKEMILTDPPRVVLDLMIAASESPVVAPKPVRPLPEPSAPVAEPAVAEPVVAAPVVAEPMVAEPAPVERRLSAPAETAFEPEEIAEPAAAVVEEEAAAMPETARVPSEARSPEAEAARGVQRSPEAGAAERRADTARTRLAADEESHGAPFDIAMVGWIAGGVLALLLVVVTVVRRGRSTAGDVDVTALAAQAEAPDDASDEWRIPAGGFAMEAPAGGPSAPAEEFEFGGSDVPDDEEKPIAPIAKGPQAVPGLFDQAPKEKEAMTMDNQDLPISQLDSEAATHLAVGASGFGVGGDSDVARMIQEFERRVAHLETRLNESIDARERLERQVAAQSEELRVQRAAIARTQRALRSLNRSDEEQATEPALRDPSKPSGPQ